MVSEKVKQAAAKVATKAAQVVDAVPAGAIPTKAATSTPASKAATATVPKNGKGKKKHRQPSEFDNHEMAIEINDMLDLVDPAPAGSMIVDPASKFKVGQCAVATAAEFTESPDMDIHPGYLLIFAVLAYGAVVGMHYWFSKKGVKTKVVQDRRPQAASPTSAAEAASVANGHEKKEGLFAGI